MILSTFDALNFVIKRVLTLVCFYIFCFFHTFSSWCQFKLTLRFLPFITIKKLFFKIKSCFRWFQHRIFLFKKQNKKFAITGRYGLMSFQPKTCTEQHQSRTMKNSRVLFQVVAICHPQCAE